MVKGLVALLAVAMIAGCSNSRIRSTPTSEKPTPWFCQIDESRSGWECVQDEDLARHPRPERLPNDPVAEPAPATTPGIIGEMAMVDEESITTQIANPSADIDVERMVAALSRDDSVSARLLEMPEESFAVQLIALDNRQLAEAFVEKHRLEDALIVQLAREDHFYYVVILGLHDTFAEAQAHAETRPSSLADIKPWIRSLGSIQAAIRQAESLLATEGP